MDKQNVWNWKFVSITLVLIGVMLLAGCTSRARVGELQTESQSVELGDGNPVHVEIAYGAGILQVAGGSDKLLEADFTYNVAAQKPEVTYTDDQLVVRQPDVKGLPVLRGLTDYRSEWNLRFSDEVPMDLSLEIGAGSGDLQLADLDLTGLHVSLGAGDYSIDLSGDWARGLDVILEAGAANLSVLLPADMGARVTVEAGPHLIEAQGLDKNGNVYTNAAYGGSGASLQVTIQAGIGQIFLVQEEPAQ